MKHWKSIVSLLLAAAMLLGCVSGLAEAAVATAPNGQLTLDDIEAFGAKAYSHDGRATFVDGACTDQPVRSMDDAADVVDTALTLLGGDAKTRFEPWRTLTDASGNIYYVFQQMQAETTVLGGAVKVVTDADGNMLGLVGSVESDLPDVKEAEGITAEKAEALALEHARESNLLQAELVEGRTEKVILPVTLVPDVTSDELDESNHYVWAVYTTNPGAGSGAELPYLAHYVTMDGEYLYNLPTILPGDEASTSGFKAAYVFEFMEPAEYTGAITLSDGTEREITVTLMRDSRTGMYYLGNIERRIAVADCYEFLYNAGNVVLEASADNTGWDNTCLLSLYNYCRAWDYYKEIGWIGGDGLGTPMLILKNFCNGDHTPIDNAAYAGHFYGWQAFLSSDINDYSQCLDVLAHEFTHCVTGSVMTYNSYRNDYGAINEAMSDIQGNVCEMMMGATEDTTWMIGENSFDSGAIRSMSDPHQFNQPDFTWDLRYIPAVKSPTLLNDEGGVHTNSSLLNNVAYRLCENGGMTLEEARAFWFAVDCSMVPGTDYAQLSELMPWVLRNQGMEKYETALEAAMDATRLRSNDLPDTFDDDRALITLKLPDQEDFTDGYWQMFIFSVDVDGFAERLKEIEESEGGIEGFIEDLLVEVFGDELKQANGEPASTEEMVATLVEAVMALMEGEESADGDETASEESDAGLFDTMDLASKLVTAFRDRFGDLFYFGNGAAGQDGLTVRMVCRPGMTLPVLYRIEIDDEMHIHNMALAAYTFGKWIDLGALAEPILNISVDDLGGFASDDAGEAAGTDTKWLDDLMALIGSVDSEDANSGLFSDIKAVFAKLANWKWILNQLFFKIERGAVSEVPSKGLEDIRILNVEDYALLRDLTSAMTEAGDAGLVDYGTSALYAQADLEAASKLVLDEFATYEGCELHDLRYAGDEFDTLENIIWMNSLGEGKDYVQVAKFISDFHSPVEGGGAWEADTEYKDYEWWLAREADGEWQLVTMGY